MKDSAARRALVIAILFKRNSRAQIPARMRTVRSGGRTLLRYWSSSWTGLCRRRRGWGGLSKGLVRCFLGRLPEDIAPAERQNKDAGNNNNRKIAFHL